MPTLALDRPRDIAHGSNLQTQSSDRIDSGPRLVNPVLAFVKAFRLKGDRSHLSSLLIVKFSVTQLVNALKDLWFHCHADLIRLDFAYVARRSSDPGQLFNTVLSDMLTAFDKLDIDKSLPEIFCEAVDLVSLPTLDPDPVSKQLELNTCAVKNLTDTVSCLQSSSSVPATPEIALTLSTTLDSLTELVQTAEKIKDELSSSVRHAISSISSLSSPGSNVSRPPESNRGVAPKKDAQTIPPDRRSNIILFGLPEKDNLEDTKSIVDEVFSFVVGKDVNWSDAFRLGRRKANVTSDPLPPRPLLVKLVSEWDKRLLLSSKYKLKNFTSARVFLSEDLPPEVRVARAKQCREEQELARNPPPPCSRVIPIGPEDLVLNRLIARTDDFRHSYDEFQL